MNVIVTGSIAFDYLMSFNGRFSEHFLPDKLDSISVSFLVDSLKKRRGGCAANLALLGEKPLLVGAVGKDFTEYGEALKKIGVDISGLLERPDEYTASFFANSDSNGNQIASFYTGAMKHAKNISVKRLWDQNTVMAIVAPDDPDAMRNHVLGLREIDASYIYDPGQQIVLLSGEDLKDGTQGAKMLILNDYELEMFKNKTGLKKDEDILEWVPTIIVTLGEKGSKIITGTEKYHIPIASPREVLDPTGVGDAYRAGLIKGMVHGLSWETAGRMGSLAAAYVLETDGPQNHTYTIQTFVQRYRQLFGESDEIGRLLITQT
ncbi:carbohydrate kinase family protein [bacterium]